jgi:glutathione S-transferase
MLPPLMAIRLHGYLLSTYVRTAVMTCIEKGVDHELVPLAYGQPEHLAMHGFGKMPVLEHDGRTVIETLAIVDYIDRTFDGPELQGGDRTRMLEWISICSDHVYRNVVIHIPRKRPATEEERATARQALERVDARIDGPFLAGDVLTLADLYLAPQISNALEKAPGIMDGLGNTLAWYAPITERDSFTQTTYSL